MTKKKKLSKRQQRIEDRKAKTVKYDLDPELKQAVKHIAEEQQIPQSHVAMLLMLYGLDAVKSGEIPLSSYLKPSRSPIFEYVLDIDKIKADLGIDLSDIIGDTE